MTREPGMQRFHVLGYDAAGRELFSLGVEAMNEQDAKLIALRALRETPRQRSRAGPVG
jgi:hypothetical protein